MEKILVIAENEELGEILANYLNSNNFAAEAVSSLEMAQAKMKTKHYQLVIADVPSKKGPGLTLCRNLRALDEELPLLFICDIPVEGNFFSGLHLQFVEYIIKPFRKDEFNQKIRNLLGDSIKKQVVVPA